VVPRSRVKEAVKVLLAAREFTLVHVGHRALVQVAPPRAEPRPSRRPA
jgi:hypothetical protein